MVNVVLIEPRIPQNTGNIARLCLCANATLHLIHPLGFRLDSKEIKRSGMDYFNKVNILQWDCLSHFFDSHKINNNHFFMSTKGIINYFDAEFKKDCFIYFGREDAGIPDEILLNYKDKVFKIPMFNNTRSLNLANSVSIVVYEAIRQNMNTSLTTSIFN